MSVDHPLAGRDVIRLRDCAAFPVGLPTAQYGMRHLVDLALMRSSVTLSAPAAEFATHIEAELEAAACDRSGPRPGPGNAAFSTDDPDMDSATTVRCANADNRPFQGHVPAALAGDKPHCGLPYP